MKLSRLILCAALLAASPALPHSWYSAYCCSGRDCAPIPASAVHATKDGWEIDLRAGQYPLMDAPFHAVIPYNSRTIQKSEDEDFHLCVVASRARCLYVPPLGQ